MCCIDFILQDVLVMCDTRSLTVFMYLFMYLHINRTFWERICKIIRPNKLTRQIRDICVLSQGYLVS